MSAVERTVGAALRGRPRVESCSPIPWPSLYESLEFNAGAATEGRPYSSFHGSVLDWPTRGAVVVGEDQEDVVDFFVLELATYVRVVWQQ
jgi:hypothetical protein